MPKKSQTPKKKTPSVAVVGGGYWGKNLVRNFYNLNALKIVSDKSEAILAGLKDQFKGLGVWHSPMCSPVTILRAS